MISRISGICIGVGLSLLISVIVYPSSATVKALACMRQVSQATSCLLLLSVTRAKLSTGCTVWLQMPSVPMHTCALWSSLYLDARLVPMPSSQVTVGCILYTMTVVPHCNAGTFLLAACCPCSYHACMAHVSRLPHMLLQSLTGLVELNAMAWQEPAMYQLPGAIASKMRYNHIVACFLTTCSLSLCTSHCVQHKCEDLVF